MSNPGWYPDPVDATARRYWDGSAWSAPLPIDAAPTEPQLSTSEAPGEAGSPGGAPEPSKLPLTPSATRIAKVRVWTGAHRLATGLLVIAVVAVAVVTYRAVANGPTMTVQGDVSFGEDIVYPSSIGAGPDANGKIECNGTYDSGLLGGDPVKVKVGGDPVATGTLDQGSWDASSTTCTMTFTIQGVPADEDDYDVSIGNGNPVKFTKQEMIDGPSICRGSQC